MATKKTPGDVTTSHTPNNAAKISLAQPPKATANRLIFPDVGLHLAVLGALIEQGVLDEDDLSEKLEGLDLQDNEEADLRLAMARLHKVGISPRKAEAIESLDFDGGNVIYFVLEGGAGTDTGGETDVYSLGSLEGIGALRGLKSLDLDSHGGSLEPLDLRPLAAHPSLETLRLNGPCTHEATLETLPNLSKVIWPPEGFDKDVLTRLEARGVQVER